MSKLKRILVSIVLILFVLILYAILDIATNSYISTGVMKYISIVAAVSIAVGLSVWADEKIK